MIIRFLITSLFLAPYHVKAQQKKIYIAPDDHTDYMWTANEEEYHCGFIETLDYYIKLNDSTANEPYEYQSKWNCDGSYWVYVYKKNKNTAEFNKLVEQIKAGRITVPLNTLISVSGAAPTESVIRSMYYAGSLERDYNLDLPLAYLMEDQVLPLGMASLFAGSGAKYSWYGVCACATKVTGFNNRTHEIYWYKGLDDQRVLMKWYSTQRPRNHLGSYGEAGNIDLAIDHLKIFMDNNPKYPYNMAAAFGKGGDDFTTMTKQFITAAKQKSDSNYQVIISNEVDFLSTFEKEYGTNLPSETVSYGTEWGNSIASLAEVSASVKRSIEKLRTAEALYTFVALKDTSFATALKEKREQAWIACGLYFEHDWTADGKHISRHERAAWQRKIANEISSYVDSLYSMSLNKFSKMISKPKVENEVFFVFNSLGWERNDYCDYPYTGSSNIHVIDRSSSKDIPFQLVTHNAKMYLRVWVSDMPSVGYKTVEIVPGASKEKFTDAAVVNGNTIENNFNKITFSPRGAITSWIDKANSKELVKPINNLYVNDLGTSESKNNAAVTVENDGPVSVTLVANANSPVRHTSKLTLYKNSDRIDLENYITQNDSNLITYAFSLNLTNTEIWHEETGAILKAKLASKGGHYADSISRLDWLTLNHFADLSDPTGNGVILSNRDAYFFKPGNSDIHSLDDKTPQLNVLAAGQVDKDLGLGIIAQDGDSYFETFFALKSHRAKYSATDAMKFSMEHQNPLIAGKVSGGSTGYPDKSYSLINISNPDVLVWSLKPAEEGIDQGVVLRLWNMSDANSNCTISSVHPILHAKRITHIETDISDMPTNLGKIILELGHNRMETYRLFLKK